mgnify:CR=1 FL=1
MVRILSIDHPTENAVSWWRNLRPLTELQRRWPDIQVRFLGEGAPLHEILACDMVIMYRPMTEGSLKFIQMCRAHGKKIIIDIDDNLWRLPPGHPLEIEYHKYSRQINEIYAHADGIWCSVDALMDFADARDGRGRVIPNAILESDLPDEPAPYKGSVCWRGSSAQIADIESEEAKAVFQENKDKFKRWFFWGYYPASMRSDNTTGIARVDLVSYFLGLRNNGFNIMWKPLQDNQFNDGKSNIAWLEATMAGAICVTNYAPEKPGWEWAVGNFTDNPDFIASQWQASREAILEHYELNRVNTIRYNHILTILGILGETIKA